jgi:hypothetical protein
VPTVKGYRQLGEMSGSLELGDKKVISRYALEYCVIADNLAQGVITIRSTIGLPKVGVSTYAYAGESDPRAVCKKKSPRRDTKQPLVWYVRCDFDDDPRSQSEENEDDDTDAVDRPVIVTWDSEYGEEILYRDFSDPRKPIVTPVNHMFDPPPTKKVIYPVCIIERFEPTFTPATILTYEDHVNTNDFFGAAAGRVLMAKITAKQVIEDATKLWQVTYRLRFAIHEDGFTMMPLNQDSMYRPTAGATPEPFLKKNVPYIGNLNLDGTASGDTKTFGGADGVGFKPYPSADFDALGLT